MYRSAAYAFSWAFVADQCTSIKARPIKRVFVGVRGKIRMLVMEDDDTAFDFRRHRAGAGKRSGTGRSDASQITTVKKEPEIITQPDEEENRTPQRQRAAAPSR